MSSTGFDTFFRSDHLLLVAFLQKIGFEQEVAKDAAADAMLYACRNWAQIENPRGWVRRAAYRIACRQVRRASEAPRRAAAGGWVAPTHLDPDVVQLKEEQEQLLRALRKLPHKQRLVMAWHIDGFSDNEISEQLDIPPSTVRSHRRHAREKLKKAYRDTSAVPQHASSGDGEGAIR